MFELHHLLLQQTHLCSILLYHHQFLVHHSHLFFQHPQLLLQHVHMGSMFVTLCCVFITLCFQHLPFACFSQQHRDTSSSTHPTPV